MARAKRSTVKSKVVPLFDASDAYSDEDEQGEAYFDEDDITGGEVRLRSRCPLCGMVGDVYKNTKMARVPSVEGYPYVPKVWRVKYGGFRWDPKRKKRLGRMKYTDLDEAIPAMLKVYLVQAFDLCGDLVRQLKAAGLDLPDDIAGAVRAIGGPEKVWAELDWLVGDVTK